MEVYSSANKPCTWKGVIKLSPDEQTEEDDNIKKIMSYINIHDYSLSPIALLSTIFTDEDSRRNGFGKQGIEEFEIKAKNYGAKIMLAWVMDDQTTDECLINFYEQSGWTIIERTPPACMIGYKLIN